MNEINVVVHWHDLLNKGEIEEVKKLAHEDIKIGGPKGITQGKEVLGEWFQRAKVTLHPEKYYRHKNIILVEELGKWHSETGEVVGSHTVFSVFEIVNNKIASIMRYDDLNSALEASGLNKSDEVNI